MKKSIYISFYLFFQLILSFNSNAQNEVCKKCDTKIIDTVNKNWDKLTDTQLEQFLCSFDQSCGWNASYSKLAYEMLIVQLDRELFTCSEIISKNKNIAYKYLLSLISNDLGNDLPYGSIIKKLSKKSNKNDFELQLYNALKSNPNLQ